MSDELVLEKKSKKSKKTLDLDAVTDEVADLDLTKAKKEKKKKKDKGDGDASEKPKKEKKKKEDKKKDSDDEEDADSPKTEKKKKSKKTKASADAPDLVLGEKKAKSKKKAKTAKAVGRDNEMKDSAEDPASFEYSGMLDRIFGQMKVRGLGKGDKEIHKFIVPPPKMSRMGTKRSVYENFRDTCDYLKRDMPHVQNYILAELGATGNPTEKGTLIIKGKFSVTQMENILRPYIKEYVLCKTCKSPNTILSKTDRLTFMECLDCSSRSTVTVTKSGFSAVIGKRKKIKEQQGGAATLSAQTKV